MQENSLENDRPENNLENGQFNNGFSFLEYLDAKASAFISLENSEQKEEDSVWKEFETKFESEKQKHPNWFKDGKLCISKLISDSKNGKIQFGGMEFDDLIYVGHSDLSEFLTKSEAKINDLIDREDLVKLGREVLKNNKPEWFKQKEYRIWLQNQQTKNEKQQEKKRLEGSDNQNLKKDYKQQLCEAILNSSVVFDLDLQCDLSDFYRSTFYNNKQSGSPYVNYDSQYSIDNFLENSIKDDKKLLNLIANENIDNSYRYRIFESRTNNYLKIFCDGSISNFDILCPTYEALDSGIEINAKLTDWTPKLKKGAIKSLSKLFRLFDNVDIKKYDRKYSRHFMKSENQDPDDNYHKLINYIRSNDNQSVYNENANLEINANNQNQNIKGNDLNDLNENVNNNEIQSNNEMNQVVDNNEQRKNKNISFEEKLKNSQVRQFLSNPDNLKYFAPEAFNDIDLKNPWVCAYLGIDEWQRENESTRSVLIYKLLGWLKELFRIGDRGKSNFELARKNYLFNYIKNAQQKSKAVWQKTFEKPRNKDLLVNIQRRTKKHLDINRLKGLDQRMNNMDDKHEILLDEYNNHIDNYGNLIADFNAVCKYVTNKLGDPFPNDQNNERQKEQLDLNENENNEYQNPQIPLQEEIKRNNVDLNNGGNGLDNGQYGK